MSDVLRSTTFQLAFNGADGLTGIKQFTTAVRDADGTVTALNEKLGDNATATYKTVRSKAELTAEAKAIARQMTVNAKNTEKLTAHYKLLSDSVGKTADEIEILNAVSALGSNATEAQKNQVIQSIQQFHALRGATEGAQGSMRNLRGITQNFGWQMQDTVVQLQMGTSAFVVLSQQGSQMASAFGPSGAIIGAIIAIAGAVGGTLYKSLNTSAGAMERLDKANQEYAKYLSVSTKGTSELSSELEKLAKFSKLAADQQVRLARGNILKEQKEAYTAINRQIKDIVEFGGNMRTALGLPDVESVVEFRAAMKGLQDGVNAESLERFRSALTLMNSDAEGASTKLPELEQSLLTLYQKLSEGVQLLDDTEKGWEDIAKSAGKATDDITKAFMAEYNALVKQTESTQQEYQRRKKFTDDYVAQLGKEDEKSIAARALLEQWYTGELAKEAAKRQALSDKMHKAATAPFEAVAKMLNKQTETTDQEYNRLKAIIDGYVVYNKGSNDEIAKAYSDLNQWKLEQDDKEFQSFLKGIIKKTDTVQEEYDRQKAIIDNHVILVGSIDAEAAAAYAALEAWKTDRVSEEYEKREAIRRRIENAQFRVKAKTGPIGGIDAEKDLYARNKEQLNNQLKNLGEEELAEMQRINTLLEEEKLRHDNVMKDLNAQVFANQVATVGMAAQSVSSLVDLMTTGAADVREKTKEMTGAQKAMFLITQFIAAAQAFVSGISLGSQLAAIFPLAAPAMVATGTAIGAAQAGAIMGVTLAGAFDKGGMIPAGQAGIVSEYGDELVNGVVVKGPARVTSREETARMMGGSGSTKLNVSIENQIAGAQFDVQQLSEHDVRIIARQEFNRNIDQGISSSLANPNSKTASSMRRNYNTSRNL